MHDGSIPIDMLSIALERLFEKQRCIVNYRWEYAAILNQPMIDKNGI